MSERNSREAGLTIDTVSLFSDLKRHWWNILLMLVAGALVAYVALANFTASRYTSNTVLAVLGNSSTAVSNVQNASKMSSSITSVFSSDALRNLVAKEIGSGDFSLSVSYITDTNLISVTASSSTPQIAFEALKSALENYPTLLSNLMADLYFVTVQQPTIAAAPGYSASLLRMMALGAGGCAAIYIMAVLLLSLLRDTVKNTSDMRRKIDGRLLGRIPYIAASKRGSDNLVLATTSKRNFQFEENYQLIAGRVLTYLTKHQGKTLAVTSVLQNEGKTHCLLNLAYSMAKNQKRVLVIDADFRNPSVAQLLNLKLSNPAALAEAIQNGSFQKEDLYQIPSTKMYFLLNSEKQSALSRSLSNGKFAQLLQYAALNFDYILVDTGPVSLVSDTTVIAAQCDASVLLVAQEAALVRAVNDAIDALDRNGTMIGCIYRETRPTVMQGRFSGYGTSYGYGYGYGSEKKTSKEKA